MDIKQSERKKDKVLIEWQDEDEGLTRGEAPKSIVNGDTVEDAVLPLVKKIEGNWVSKDIRISAGEVNKTLKDYGIFTKDDARKNPEKVRRALGVLLKTHLSDILS